MKKIFFFLLLVLPCLHSFSQKAKVLSTTYFDANGNQINNEKNAATFKVITQQDDTTFTEQYYQNYGAMLWQKTYKDKNLTLLHGFSNWYNSDGDCDSVIYYANGNVRYIEHLSEVSFKDGHSEKMLVPIIRDTDTAERFSTVQIETKFPDGGEIGWRNYIGKHLNTSVGKLIPKYKNLQDKKAVVKISFLINKNGEITEVDVLHSSGYPFDTEAMRVIKNAPKWNPAYQNGKPVSYRQQQRIIFQVQ